MTVCLGNLIHRLSLHLYAISKPTYPPSCFLFLNLDVTVGFEQLSYPTEEGATVTVCAMLSGQIERDVFVTLTTVSGTADGMLA